LLLCLVGSSIWLFSLEATTRTCFTTRYSGWLTDWIFEEERVTLDELDLEKGRQDNTGEEKRRIELLQVSHIMAADKSLTEERDDYKKGYSPSSTTGSDAPRDHNLDEEKYGNADEGEPRGFDGLANVSEGQGEVFGDETDKQVKYRTMEWWHAALVMIAETISLGILSLPSSMAGLGLVPGVILIIGLGAVSTYTGYVFWQFKMRFPHVHNIADVGEIFLGPIGRELGGLLQTIYLIFIMGSHLLTWTIALNTITNHATCTIVFSVIGLLLQAVLTIPRTLKSVSYLSIFAFISIFAAVMVTMVSVGVTRPDPTVYATVTTSFASAFSSVMNIIFAFGGHVAFFSFISELKDPRDFPKALYTLQIVNTSLYVIAAVVIYRFAGPGVASPALGSGSHLIRKITYGISIPTIVIAGVIYGHVASKYIYVRLFRGTRHLHERTLLSYGSWIGILFALWTVAWIIAESVPVFNNLVGLIAALFASWFTYGLAGFMWIYLNWGGLGKNWKKIALTVVNLLIFALGAASCGLGLYASGLAISQDKSGASWSCADNGV
jgi:amino acid permease